MNPMSLVTAALQAAANYFGWSLQRSQINNAPDIKDRKERQEEGEHKAEFDKAMQEGDVEKIRKELAE